MTIEEAIAWCYVNGVKVNFGKGIVYLHTHTQHLDGPDLPSVVEQAIGIEQEQEQDKE